MKVGKRKGLFRVQPTTNKQRNKQRNKQTNEHGNQITPPPLSQPDSFRAANEEARQVAKSPSEKRCGSTATSAFIEFDRDKGTFLVKVGHEDQPTILTFPHIFWF